MSTDIAVMGALGVLLNELGSTGVAGSAVAGSLDGRLCLENRMCDLPDQRSGRDALYALGHSNYPDLEDDRAVPTKDTICQYTMRLARPIKINALANSPFLKSMPTVELMGIGGYLGAPIILEDGICIGTMCLLSDALRIWSEAESETLQEAAKLPVNRIELLIMWAENRRLSGALGRSMTKTGHIGSNAPNGQGARQGFVRAFLIRDRKRNAAAIHPG